MIRRQLSLAAQDHRAEGAMRAEQAGKVRGGHAVFVQQVAHRFPARNFAQGQSLPLVIFY